MRCPRVSTSASQETTARLLHAVEVARKTSLGMSFLSDQRNFSPRTGSGVPPQLIEAASPHLRTSTGLEVAKEAEPGKVEAAHAEVAEIMVNMT